MKVKFKKLHHEAKIPTYANPNDSGADIYANVILTCDSECVGIEPHSYMLIKTGIAMELPEGYEAQVRSRSGLANKFGIQAHFGTIDNGYRGDLGVILFNHSDKPYCINQNDRIGQLIISPICQFEFEEVNELEETVRGEGGFGHSGV